MGNSALKTEIIEVEEGTDSFKIVRCPDNRPATDILKRVVAEIIDMAIIFLIFFPFQFVAINICEVFLENYSKIKILNTNNLNLIIFLSTFYVIKSGYYYILYRQKCSTLGKKFFNFRIYRLNTQEPIGIIRIIFREIIGKNITLLFLPFSLAWYLYDTKSRFPHDLIAGTMAVEELKEHNGIDY